MSTFNVPTREEVSTNNQAIFDNLNKALGFVPNLYATYAHSDTALENYLNFANAKTSLSVKEKEVVNLAVSQVNNCIYCLSAHTAIGKMNGLSEEETEENRKGKASEEKVQVGLQFAQSITKNRGNVTSEEIKAFKEAGYNDSDVLEVVLNVVANTLTNYVNHIAETEIDFPKVEAGKYTVKA